VFTFVYKPFEHFQIISGKGGLNEKPQGVHSTCGHMQKGTR
jgi:hypothetical protein